MYYKSHVTNNKHPKVHYEQYLYNFSEPKDDTKRDLPPELEAELVENSLGMKRQFRQLARTNRNQYLQ